MLGRVFLSEEGENISIGTKLCMIRISDIKVGKAKLE
jgi:hypothetical protein